MADEKHVELLANGVKAWNAWRLKERLAAPDLSEADLTEANLSHVNLREANLRYADLSEADLSEADLSEADLTEANLRHANLSETNLNNATLFRAKLSSADLRRANLTGANLFEADLDLASLREANLSEANLLGTELKAAKLNGANLGGANLMTVKLWAADLSGANLSGANLTFADLNCANLSKAKLCGANLVHASLANADLTDANLTGCSVYGLSAWGLKLSPGTKQQNLVITPEHEPQVTVDNVEIAQFVYLLLRNERIRDAIDTIGKKGVLLLGRFTGGRIAVLERLRDELRERNFLPIVFNFDKPETKDLTETVRLLAGLSRFVIVDVTNPRSAPLELQATVPEYMIPFVPIIERGEEPFSMFKDLWIKHRDWVLDPIRYPSVDRLIEVLDAEIIGPANERYNQLLARKAEQLRIKDI